MPPPLCAKRYDFAVRDRLFSSLNGFIHCAVKYFINKSVDSHTLNSANLLLELRMVKDNLLQISDNVISSDDLQCLIELSLSAQLRFCDYQCICFVLSLMLCW